MQVFPLQIRIVAGGLWHRRVEGNGRNHTACGIEFPKDWIPATRDHVLDDLICPECFTRHEVQTGVMKALAKERQEFPDVSPAKLARGTSDRPRTVRVVIKTEPVDMTETQRDLPPFDPDAKKETDE
jgi:hypothetical protein